MRLKEAISLKSKERIEKCIGFMLTSLYDTVSCQKKPFNPIIGETFSGEYRVGDVYVYA